MAHLLEHIRRAIRAHACRYAVLPEVTVPSAAVTDDDTEFWGDMRYLQELADSILDAASRTAAHVACPIFEKMLTEP